MRNRVTYSNNKDLQYRTKVLDTGHMDRAFRPFFRWVKEKEKARFSRFRRDASWCAIEQNLVRLEFRENREEAR